MRNSAKWCVAMTATGPALVSPSKFPNFSGNRDGILASPLDAGFFLSNVTNAKLPVNAAAGLNAFGLESRIVSARRRYGSGLKVRFGG